MLPEDRLSPGERFSEEGGAQADTLHRLDGVAAELPRVRGAGEIDSGRDDVD